MTIVYSEVGDLGGYTAIDVDKVYYSIDYDPNRVTIRIGESVIVAHSLCINGIDVMYYPDVRVKVMQD